MDRELTAAQEQKGPKNAVAVVVVVVAIAVAFFMRRG